MWPDHIHMLLDIPPKITVSSFLGYTPGFAEGYLFVRFLGLLLLLFQPFSHLFHQAQTQRLEFLAGSTKINAVMVSVIPLYLLYRRNVL